MSDTLQILLNRSYSSLEWALNSPPKPHAFVSLPLQSSLFIRGSRRNIIRGLISLNSLLAPLYSLLILIPLYYLFIYLFILPSSVLHFHELLNYNSVNNSISILLESYCFDYLFALPVLPAKLLIRESELSGTGSPEILPAYIAETKDINMTDWEFNQWFTGFIDGEGNFYIGIRTDKSIYFNFTIKLHVDDLNALNFIESRLNCGSVQILKKESTAYFRVGGVNQIRDILIPLFEKFPLNGIKYLDYLAFKKAI